MGRVGALRAGIRPLCLWRDIGGPKASRGSSLIDRGWPAPGACGQLILPVFRCGGRRAPGGRRVECACGTSAGGRITTARDSPNHSGTYRTWPRPRRTRGTGGGPEGVGEWSFCATKVARIESLANPHRVAGARAGTSRAWRPSRGRAVLAEAQTLLETFPDAGMFPELLERQERKLHARKPREGQLDGELTERELDVLRLLGGHLSTGLMAQSLYVAPSTVRTQIKSIYRKLGVSSRSAAVEEAHARRLL